MKRKKALGLIFCIIQALFLFGCSSSSTGPVSFAPGADAGNFSLPSVTGEQLSLANFKGKVVLLNFWASWCGPCTEEAPSLQRLYERLKAKGFVVVGVAVDDTPSAVSDFKRNFGLSFPLLVDEMGATKRAFKLTGVPESFVLDRKGRFVMVVDPGNNDPTVRLVGPRSWDSAAMVEQLGAVLAR